MAATTFQVEEVDFISLLGEANRRRFLDDSTRAAYAPGAVIYHPAIRDRAYLLNSGLARGYITVPDGRQATVAFFHAGELIGPTAIVSRPPAIFVQVVVKSTVTILPLEVVRKLAAAENEVLAAIAIQMAARLRGAAKLIAVRTLGDVRQRLAFDLLDRASRVQLQAGLLEVRVTHAELANSIGSAREVVGRALASMREAGLVETAPGMVRVVDPLRLDRIVRAFAL